MSSASPEQFDLVVIGAGPSGEKGAAQAAYFGKRVAIVEAGPEPGGAAVHTGTLPSKTLRETALYLSGYRARNLYGVAVELRADATVAKLIERKDAMAAAGSHAMRHNLERHGVRYFPGDGRFADEHTVIVGGSGAEARLSAEYILIATGSRPYHPPAIDFANPHIWDSDGILGIDHLPASMAILGAGVIGCEYACMFAALGVDVTLVDSRDQLLSFLDGEMVARLSEAMGRLGICLVQGRPWTSAEHDGASIVTTLRGGEQLHTECLLFTAGRVGNTGALALERIGVVLNERGYVSVDDRYRTSCPSVLAAGDVIGFPSLASVGMEQARVAVCRAFGFEYKQAVSAIMPFGIYTIPEVSSVGETEESARAKGMDIVVGRAYSKNNARGQIMGDLDGVTKLIVERGTRRIVGVHVIGERATELVHIGQTALHVGAPVDLFIDMVFNYPTLAEAYKYAAYECLAALNRD